MLETRNTKAIENIIAELAMKDYLRVNKGKKKLARSKPYSLSAETLEAREVLHDYIGGKITEEEYKAWCLNYNLRTS